MSKGKIFLLPTPLGDEANDSLPPYLLETIHQLDYFLVERLRTARRFLRSVAHPLAIDELTFGELNKDSSLSEINDFLKPVISGRSAGVLSEAGCPGIADPGSRLVARAHEERLEVVPVVGPSSILLALMASGMNGQGFTFHGYLSHNKKELGNQLRKLEKASRQSGQTQIFMETPYRNRNVLEIAAQVLQDHTLFCVAADLTQTTQWIRTMSIQSWRKHGWPDIHKRPAVFLLY